MTRARRAQINRPSFLRFARFLMASVLVGLVTACGGGGGGGGDSPTPTTPTTPTTAAKQVDIQDLGLLSVQILDNATSVVKGQAVYGQVKASYGPSVRPADITYTLDSGVMTQLAKGTDGETYFTIDAKKLTVGKQDYVVRATNVQTQNYALIKGTLTVVEPAVQSTTSLGAQGASIDLGDGKTASISANNLEASVQIATTVANTDNGKKIQFSLSKSALDKNIKITLPQGKPAYDPYSVLSSANVGSQSILAKISQAIQKVVQAFSSPSLNKDPYVSDSTANNGIKPIISNGLGQVVLQGDEVAFDSALDVISERFWDPTFGLPSYNDSGIGVLDKIKSTFNDIKDATELFITTELRPAYEVQTSITGDVRSFKWDGYEPILFVHGFNLTIGGGEGTWGNFPKLAMQTALPNGNNLVPFEFHWYTNQSFRLAADDLATTVEYIYKLSGKKVHIVAHSFGGVLTRTMLQGLSRYATAHREVGGKVASLMTLGSPHSGVLSADRVIDEISLPDGQFAGGLIPRCQAVSCYEMGQLVTAFSEQTKQDVGLSGNYAQAGYLPAAIARSENKLPSIPVYVGIGLGVNTSNLVADGDYLISFAGQRFRPNNTSQARSNSLLQETKVGNATVTEVLLGLTPEIRPGQTIANNKLPVGRAGGYYHSSTTGRGNWISSDDDKLGLMASPNYGCATTVSCLHAGYLLFRQLQNDVLTGTNVGELTLPSNMAAQNLVVKNKAAWTSAQLATIQAMIDNAKAKSIISGKRIVWERLSENERKSELGKLVGIPDTERTSYIKNNYSEQFAALNQYLSSDLYKANWSATGQGLYGRGALNDWLAVAGAGVKSVTGVLQIAYPVAAIAADGGTQVIQQTSDTQKMVQYIIALNRSTKVISLINNCLGLGSRVNEYQTAVREISNDNLTSKNFSTAITVPLQFVSSLASAGNMSNAALIADVFTGSVTLSASNEKMVMAQVWLNLVNSALAMFPDSVSMQYAKGTLNVVTGCLDAYVIGQQMNARADEAFVISSDVILKGSQKMTDTLMAERVLAILNAKTTDLYTAGFDATIKTSVPTVTVGSSVDFWLEGAPSNVGLVAWQLTGYTEQTANVSAGVAGKISITINTAGSYAATITYYGGANKTGTLLGTQTYTFTVCAVGQGLNASGVCAENSPTPPTITGAAAQANGTVVVSGTAANNANIKITWPDSSTTLLVASGSGGWSTRSSSTYAAGALVKANTYNTTGNSALVSATITAYTTSKLTDTGITANQCYGAGSNTLISCTSSAAISLNSQQDGMVGRDVSNNDDSDGKLGFSYSRVGSYALTECVKDNITGLMWEGKPVSGSGATRGSPALNPNGTYTNYQMGYTDGDGNAVTQARVNASSNAQGYVAAINATDLCGYSDWRLPTRSELQSIVDYSVAYPGPTVDGNWFPNTQQSLYWTSSPYAGYSGYAWYVDFSNGYVDSDYRYGSNFHVRLVR